MIETLFEKSSRTTYSTAFLKFGPEESFESLSGRLMNLKSMGLDRVIAGYATKNRDAARFDNVFFSTLDELVKACRATGMTFWLEDYAPFPTGSANGAFREPENAKLNKLFLDERHIDIAGPVENALIRVDDLQRVTYGKAIHRFAKVDPLSRKRIAVIAYRLRDNPACAAAPVLEDEEVILLDDAVKDGFLQWNVPDGYWRVFVVFETYESSGRPYFMNLLSRESVALEIKKVHEPFYEHLKEELGKTWNGFFYDEPEIGNAGDAKVFDFFMLPGRRTMDRTDCNVYPWSSEMPDEMTSRDKDWRKKLPYLWYDGKTRHGKFRCDYMDAVTTLIRENYNGQVYAFCRERGIHYIGHVLEDENCHTRLGCGPGHYFRQQYYQDEAGIDVIAGQIMPGRDKAISWYGVANADGEFYHYGLAKLASSEARINPLKMNRSVCEAFAMYGPQGLAERKYVVDHLMVNGVNRILFADFSAYEASPDYAKALVDYTDKICGLLRNATPVIKTAVLYHAEAEWGEGENAQPFQKPGAELARNQISYDVIPADVFRFPDMYRTNAETGLCVNGNAYEALIIPATSALPESVERFIRERIGKGFPVFFVDRVPDCFSDLPATKLKDLAEAVRKGIACDIEIRSSRKEWIRYMHVQSENEDFYLIHNQAPTGETECQIILNTSCEVLAIDLASGIVLVPDQQKIAEGRVGISCRFGQHEMKILYVSRGTKSGSESPVSESRLIRSAVEIPHNAGWELELPDGRVLSFGADSFPEIGKLLGFDFYGKLIYRSKCTFGNRLPRLLDLGAASDCCEVILNGKSLGKRMATPYLFDVKDVVKTDVNELVVEIVTSAVNLKYDRNIFGIPVNALDAVPYAIVPSMGMSGKIKWLFEN